MKVVMAVKCREVGKLLAAYGDGELDGREREAVAGHLKSCAACRAEEEKLAASLQAFRALAHDAGWAPPRNTLAAEISHAVERPSLWTLKAARIARVAAAALVLLAVIAGLVWASRQNRREPMAVAPLPAPRQQPAPSGTVEDTAGEAVAQGIFEARLAAAKAAMIPRTEDEPVPDICLTATELYAQIPAVMLVAADQVNYAVGNKEEAARKYQRIVELFPESKQARIAAERLAQLRQEKKEG